MTHHFAKPVNITLTIAALTLGLFSCGKVTQEVAPPETRERRDFTITAVTDVVSTANYAATQNTRMNTFVINQTDAYFVVSGLVDSEKPKILSWGKAEIDEEVDPSGNVSFNSFATNKSNVRITASNLKESLLTLQENRSKDPSGNAWTWQGRASKLKDEYDGYLVQFFTSGDNYQVYYIEKSRVSGNTLISIPSISEYDNFMATLIITDLHRVDHQLKKRLPESSLRHLFTQEFFDNITYTPAKNQVKNFRLKTPEFRFNGKIEHTLLELVDMIHNTDKNESEEFVRKAKWKWMNDKARKELVAAIISYKIPDSAVEVDAEENASDNSRAAPTKEDDYTIVE